MYTVAVMDKDVLAAFRSEHPWLELPADVEEISLFFDDNGGPARLTATSNEHGRNVPFDTDRLRTDTLLALIRFAPRGTPKTWESPEEARVWRILDRLPTAEDATLIDVMLEQARRAMLEEAYSIVHKMATQALRGLAASASSSGETARLEAAARAVPLRLGDIADEHKALFLEVDLWRMVAVLRDEASLPIDYEMPPSSELDELDALVGNPAVTEGVSDSLIQALFDLSPVAFSISTIGRNSSRYVRVNKAYLDLVGKSWDEIRGHEMVSSGLVIGNDARARRLEKLDKNGEYSGERAEIRNTNGDVIPVLISARRLVLAGVLYDFEVIAVAAS
jgi:PAS domain-containing protein